MEKKHIDKIAAVSSPDRREGEPNPRGVGAELPPAHSASPPSSPPATPGSSLTGVSHPPSPEESAFFERNRILEFDCHLLPIKTPEEYFRVLFSRPGESGEDVSFMQATGSVYWGDHHYNAIAYNLIPKQVFDRKTGGYIWKDRAEKFDITRSLSECINLRGPDIVKVISSPILYAGRSRTKERARSIWGIAVDLDKVSTENLRTLIRFIDKFEYTLKPSMIVSSGGGLHLYYLFPKGVGTQTSTVRALQRLKHNMTKNLWNSLFSSDPNPDLHQGIWQGFRVPGTPTKMPKQMVVGFVPEEIPYYTVRELNKWFQPVISELIERDNKPLTEEEIEAVDNNKYLPSKISFKEAKIKWPEWNTDKTAGQWYSNRKLYDWWLNEVIRSGRASKEDFKGTIPLASGRRFYWILALVAYAKKCGIAYEELRTDAYSLLEQFDSLTVDEHNHFTPLDIESALKFYHKTGKDSVARFTKNYIGAKTHYQFKSTKRNGRTREENLIIARTARDVNDRKYDRQWDKNNGRKTAKLQVQLWCMDHPYNCSKTQCAKECTYEVPERDPVTKKHTGRIIEKHLDPHTVAQWWWHENPLTIPESVLRWRHDHPGVENKSLCARDCGITRPTVIKWWNCTAEDARAEFERLKSIQMAGVSAVNAKRAVVDYEQTEEQSSELHNLGAEVNAGYIADEKIAANSMQNTEGYSEENAETIRKTQDNLTDAINYGALNMEKLMRSMGIPEFLIPMLKEELQKQMQTPEFWEEYKKNNPTVDMSKWPSQARAAFEAAVEDNNKKK